LLQQAEDISKKWFWRFWVTRLCHSGIPLD